MFHVFKEMMTATMSNNMFSNFFRSPSPMTVPTVEALIEVGPVTSVNCANKGSRNFRQCLLVAVIFDGAISERKIEKKMILRDVDIARAVSW